MSGSSPQTNPLALAVCEPAFHKYGDGWGLVVPAAFKAVVRRAERLGCVRFAHVSAIFIGSGHCQPCSSGINIALVNKYADLARMQDEVPASIQAHYEALDATAADCTACEACEERCPFGVAIAERMQQAAELFGC